MVTSTISGTTTPSVTAISVYKKRKVLNLQPLVIIWVSGTIRDFEESIIYKHHKLYINEINLNAN